MRVLWTDNIPGNFQKISWNLNFYKLGVRIFHQNSYKVGGPSQIIRNYNLRIVNINFKHIAENN